MKKILSVCTCVLLAGSMILGGCGSAAQPAATTKSAGSSVKNAESTKATETKAAATEIAKKEADAQTTAAADSTLPATKKLVIWSYMNEGEPIGDWHQAVTDKFKKLYPDVDVEIVFCGREILTQFQTKLQDANADDFPDLISQGTGTMKPLVKGNQFLCIDDYLKNEKNFEGDKNWGDSMVKRLVEADQVDGKNYFIPEGLYAHGFFYDKNMFDKYNLQVPTTWDEFIKVCDTLKANGIAPVALDGTVDMYNAWWYIRFAERLAGVDKLKQAAQGQISWKDDPGFLKAAEYVSTFSSKGYFQDGAAGSVFPAAQALFTQGKCAMLFCGAWIPTEMQSQTPETMEMKMFPLPVLPNSVSEKHEEVWCNCFGITSKAKNVRNAINWLKIYTSQEMQDNKLQYKDPSVLVGDKTVPELDNIEKTVDSATSVSDQYGCLNDYGEWFTKVMYPLATKLITGTAKPQEFIDQLDADTKAFYKK